METKVKDSVFQFGWDYLVGGGRGGLNWNSRENEKKIPRCDVQGIFLENNKN